MTHRSRSGGPNKRQASKPGHGPKKRSGKPRPPSTHPSNASANGDGDEHDEHDAIEEEEEEEDDTTPPAKFFTITPTNDEILNVLRWALLDTLNSDEFPALVQKAKGLLFERKWLELFTDASLLDAYAGRWVPSRALCFRDLMAGIKDVRGVFAPAKRSPRSGRGKQPKEVNGDDQNDEAEDEAEDEEEDGEEEESHDDTPKPEDEEASEEQEDAGEEDPEPLHVLSLGGGAGSELLAVAALASHGARIKWTGVDVGAWGDVLRRIEVAARDKWRLDATFEFVEGDLLAPSREPTPANEAEAATSAPATAEAPTGPAPTGSAPPEPGLASVAPAPAPAFASIPALAHLPPPYLTTLFFTLTELLSQNRARTVALLRALTAATPVGGLLVVADSASDIAEFALGKDGRTWPVYMVLDAILAAISKAGAKDGSGAWEKVRAEDSRWFRLNGERWPCKLENARYWMRVYRRV